MDRLDSSRQRWVLALTSGASFMTALDAMVVAAGLLAFVAGPIGCALSGSLEWLVAWRAVQGVASALIAPVALAILGSAFAGPRRTRALGIFGSITGVALIAGPALGGAVTQGLSRPWVFWINVPVGLTVAFFVRRRIDEGRGASAPIDTTGAALLALAALGVAWALLRGQAVGWRTLEAAGSPARWPPARRCMRRSTAPCSCRPSCCGRGAAPPSRLR